MRVLIVEDGTPSTDSLSPLLRMSGHEVEVVPDGDAAVAAARTIHPDVVLLNLGLPQLDGYDVARRVTEQPAPKKPFLVVFSGNGDEQPRLSEEAGVDLHLVKPVAPSYLQRLLSRFQRVVSDWH